MNKKIKYTLLVAGGVIIFAFLSIIFMAVFRLCPPIDSGPQPPWCTNLEFFERDFSTKGLEGALRAKLIEWFPGSNNPESIYDPNSDNIDYFEKPSEVNDFSLDFGIAVTDFFWPVCRSFSLCIDPRTKVSSTLSRIDSLNSDFVVFTDYVRIDGSKNIFLGKGSLSQKTINDKLELAEKHDLNTMVLLNLFLDDSAGRHMEINDFGEDKKFGGSLQAKAVDYWDPSVENMNLLFDAWEEVLLKNLDRWDGADYIVVNPEDTHFHFLNHIDVQNTRNKELINLAKNNFDGEVCVHFKDLIFLKDNPEIDYYMLADCVIIGGHLPYKYFGVENDVESFEEFFVDYFSNDFFSEDIKIFQMISTMSYDAYIEQQWFEVWDLPHLDRAHASDFRLQANAFEGFFRAIQEVQPRLEGIFHYGYWWDDVDFDDDPLNVGLMNSIRNKDAEHVFYRWSEVLSN